MSKISKNCCIRLPAEIHRRAKLESYEKGFTLQDWICNLITKNLPELKESKDHGRKEKNN